MAKNKKIYHRNDVRPSLARMGLSARRILYLCIVQLEREDSGDIIFESDRLFLIKAKEYAHLCNIDESLAYRQLKEGIDSIRSHLMKVPESELMNDDNLSKKSKDRVIVFTVANHGVYSDGDGYVELKLDPIIAPYISKLRSNFTGQFLLSGLRLPDSNANKLYILLREWVSSGMSIYKDITVEELKNSLLISDTEYYHDFKRFKQFFLARAINKIIQYTEFSKIDIEIIERRKRKAHMLRISYEYEEQEKHFKDSGFMVGSKRRSKSYKSLSNRERDGNKEGLAKSEEDNGGGLKQINGRYYTRDEAKASGLNWNDY